MKRFSNEIRSVLAEVQSILSGAILAGGAVRDTLLDKPINDLDIFIPNHRTQDWMFGKFGALPILSSAASGSMDYPEVDENTGRINACYTMQRGGYEVQLVLTNFSSTSELISSFNYGLCQAAYDGNVLSVTDAFRQDVSSKTLTLLNPKFYREHHRTKLIKKFPEYTEIGGTVGVPSPRLRDNDQAEL